MSKKILALVLTVLMMASSCAMADEDKPYAGTTLTVCNWYDFIDEAVLDMFEEETGIKVNYVNFTTNEELYTKLEAGAASYDIIIPSDYIIERLIADDMLEPLNFDNIPNAANISDWIRKPAYDPEGAYSVGYMWCTVGLLYNTKMVEEPIDSWASIFDEKYQGQVIMLNSIRDSLGIALKYLGYSVNSDNPDEVEAAAQLLIEQKQNGIVSGYLVDETKDKMVAGEAAIALMWSGDAVYAIEKNEDLAYVVPKEGSNLSIDAMCIPKGAKNKEAAECFINYMCRADIAQMNHEYIWYYSTVQAAMDAMPEELRNDPTYNPTSDIIDRCEFFLDVSEYYDIYEENWMMVRIAR